MHEFFCIFRRVPPRNWAWVHFYVAYAAWTFVLGRFPPGAVAQIQDSPHLSIWTYIVLAGALAAVVGLVISAQSRALIGVGAAIELMGHIALAVGPLIYGITQIGLMVLQTEHPEMLAPHASPLDRVHLPFLSYVVISALVVRAAVVFPRFRKEATDSNKVVHH